MDDEKYKYMLNEYLHSKLQNRNLTDAQKCKLVYEMQQDIVLKTNRVLERANKYINGEIPKYGVLI